MKDHKGKRIALGSTLKCINDVDYGSIYKVESWCDTCPNLCININGVPMLLSEFDTDENGYLTDFERIDR